MKSLPAVRLCVAWGALGVGPACTALADAGACPPVQVQAAGDVLGLWPELPQNIRRVFAARDGIDTCARVWLGKDQRAIQVEVILEDGRSALRSGGAPLPPVGMVGIVLDATVGTR